MPPDETADPLASASGEGEAKAPEGQQQQAAPGLTEERAAQLIDEKLGQFAQPLNQIADFMETAQATINARGGDGEAATKQATESGADFFTDPEASTRKVASEAVSEATKPIVEAMASTAVERVRGEARTAFDARYGAGKFDEVVAPLYDNAIGRLTTQQKANDTSLRSVVAMIEGSSQLSDKLFELRVEYEAAKEEKREREEEGVNTGALTGGQRRSASATALNADQKEGLKAWNEVVEERFRMSEKEFLETQNRIHHLPDGRVTTGEEDWKGAFDAKGAA